jgi:hypothetical protein
MTKIAGALNMLPKTMLHSSLLVVLFQVDYYQVQSIHAYLHEVTEVLQQILKVYTSWALCVFLISIFGLGFM